MIFIITRTTLRSNIRLLDATNRPRQLVDRAIELGLAGIGFSEHESLGSHVELDRLQEEYKEKYPDFKIIRGNEIYLTKDRSSGQQYYHHILLALDATGHKMLRELSSQSWIQSYFDRGMERVPTLYSEIEAIIKKYGRGHIYGSSACFLPGTLVLTKNGYIPIEDISSEDKVRNRFGLWEQVIEPTRIFYTGKGYKIKTSRSIAEPIFCTAEHQFLVTKIHNIYWSKNKQAPLLTKWMQAEEIFQSATRKNIRLLQPVPKVQYTSDDIIRRSAFIQPEKKYTSRKRIYLPEEIKITNELMRLFGLFLGDGSIDIKHRRIAFSFNESEYEYYYNSFVGPALEQLEVPFSCSHREKNHKIELTIGSVEFFDLFYWLFGNAKAHNKKIPKRLLHISKELDMELFYGYFLADGYYRKRQTNFVRKNNYTNIEIVTASISRQLSYDMKDILLSLDIPCSIYLSPEKKDKKGIHHNQAWYISISCSEVINEWIKKKNNCHQNIVAQFQEITQLSNSKFVYDVGTDTKFLVMPIKTIEQIDISNNVYCLNNSSHSFVCGDVVVHNCLGSFLDKRILDLHEAEIIGNTTEMNQAHRDIVDFLLWCKNTYGDNNFSLEVQPARSEEQLIVNKRMGAIAKAFDLPICVSCDSHYLRKEDRYVHKALLNSKEGDREVDSFYAYAYLQSEDEIRENLEGTGLDYEELCANSMEIYDRCEYYTLHRNQHIVEVPVPEYPIEPENHHFYDKEKYPTLDKLMHSENPQERYWVNECQNELNLRHLSPQHFGNDTYLERLEYEADIMDYVGQRLDTCIFAYPNFLQHYIDMIWEVGSPIGVARGSAASGLNHWLLGVTGLDPIKHGFSYWRFLNKERIELPEQYWAV